MGWDVATKSERHEIGGTDRCIEKSETRNGEKAAIERRPKKRRERRPSGEKE